MVNRQHHRGRRWRRSRRRGQTRRRVRCVAAEGGATRLGGLGRRLPAGLDGGGLPPSGSGIMVPGSGAGRPENVKGAPDQGDLSPDPGTGGPNLPAAAPSPAAPPEREGSNWAQLLPIQPGEHRIRPRGCRIWRAPASNGRRRPAARRADGGGRRWGASSRGDCVEVGTPRRRRPGTRTDFRARCSGGGEGQEGGAGGLGRQRRCSARVAPGATGANSAIFECFKHITASTTKIGGKELHTFPVKRMEREIKKRLSIRMYLSHHH